MAVDLSKSAFELFSGSRRIRVVPTVAITLIVTALVVIPLTFRAVDARDDPAPIVAGDAGIVLVDTVDNDPFPLDQATVGGSILISVNDPAARAVSFNLFVAGTDAALMTSQDLDGPQFDLIVSESGGGKPLDSSLLADGEYELFLTISTSDEDLRTAVSFVVSNQ